jgi:NADH-quinone oxidoreductase E subunit
MSKIEILSNARFFAPEEPAVAHAPGPSPFLQQERQNKADSQADEPSWEAIAPRLETPAVQARVQEILRQYPVAQGALLELLWVAQNELGWVPHAAIAWAARLSGCSNAHAWGVATFYTMYHHAPQGRFLLQFCQNICCHIAGAESVIEAAEAELGIRAGETTKDGLFTLLRVECLGACGAGPVMLVGDDFANDVKDGKLVLTMGAGLDGEKVRRIIAWCRDRAQKMPVEPARDPLGGATPAAHGAPQAPDFAPPPPALAVKAVAGEAGVALTWKIAPEVSALSVERLDGKTWKSIGAPGIKDKEFVDAAGKAGMGYRVIASSAERVARPTEVVAA